MTQPGESDSDLDARPKTYTRIELPEHRPVIDVMACCGPQGANVWLNLYQERGAFLTIDQALAVASALKEQAAVTQKWLAEQLEAVE